MTTALQQNIQFVAPGGKKIIVFRNGEPNRDGDILLSTNGGATFRELSGRGYNCKLPISNEETMVMRWCINLTPGIPWSRDQIRAEALWRIKDIIILGDDTYYQQEEPFNLHSATVTPLPDLREPDALFRCSNGTYYFLDRPIYNPDDGGTKLYIGTGTLMVELELQEKVIPRRRSSDSIIVKTPNGILRWPNHARPTWSTSDGRVIELTLLNHKDFDIIYTPKGDVIITAK